jgi:hypothetical protein
LAPGPDGRSSLRARRVTGSRVKGDKGERPGKGKQREVLRIHIQGSSEAQRVVAKWRKVRPGQLDRLLDSGPRGRGWWRPVGGGPGPPPPGKWVRVPNVVGGGGGGCGVGSAPGERLRLRLRGGAGRGRRWRSAKGGMERERERESERATTIRSGPSTQQRPEDEEGSCGQRGAPLEPSRSILRIRRRRRWWRRWRRRRWRRRRRRQRRRGSGPSSRARLVPRRVPSQRLRVSHR